MSHSKPLQSNYSSLCGFMTLPPSLIGTLLIVPYLTLPFYSLRNPCKIVLYHHSLPSSYISIPHHHTPHRRVFEHRTYLITPHNIHLIHTQQKKYLQSLPLLVVLVALPLLTILNCTCYGLSLGSNRIPFSSSTFVCDVWWP
jgi:hypothetical protein